MTVTVAVAYTLYFKSKYTVVEILYAFFEAATQFKLLTDVFRGAWLCRLEE